MLRAETINKPGGVVGGALGTEAAGDFGIAFKHAVTVWAREDTLQFVTDMVDGEGVCQEFGDHFAVGNEVDERDVRHLDEITTHDAGDFGQGEFVADHLRYIEKGRLEGGGATGDEGGVSLCQQRIGLVIDHLYPTPFDEGGVIVGIDARSAGKDDTIVVHIGFHGLDHGREVVFDLLTARTGKEGDDVFRGRRKEEGGRRYV